MQEIHVQIVLKPTNVGKSFLLDAHINPRLVSKVKKNSHHKLMPNISPGIIITAFEDQLKNSTVL